MSQTNRGFRFMSPSDRRSSILSVALTLLLASVAHPQEATPPGAQARPGPDARPGADLRRESLASWQYFVELRRTPLGESPWYDCLVTPPVFDAARLDLADLRLYDADHRELPYALRIRREESQLAIIEAVEFNRFQQDDGSQQVSLDLGAEEVQHNEVEILTTGTDFRRRAVVEGSGDTEEWNQLAAGYLIDFRRNGTNFSDATVDYPPSRFRYVRVTVHPDPQEDQERAWELRNAYVRHRVALPGEYVLRPLESGPREPIRAPRGPGSQWLAHLGGTSVPCQELVVQIESNDFVRDWRVEAAGPDRPGERFYQVAAGTWQRKAGERNDTFVAHFPNEVRAARLKLLVTDYRNPPLEITSMSCRAPARQVVFEAKPELTGPFRLYFGNPDAEEPRYDFARNLPRQLEPPPTRLGLGQRQPNPIYQPKPKPLTERLPWLVHSVLAAAVLVLACLIVSLGRTALRNTDDSQENAVPLQSRSAP